LLKVEASLFLFFYQSISILQPFIGHLADRVDLRKFALLGPAVTGIFLSLLGVAPSFQIGLLLCLLAGISSSTMHAILPAMVGSYSGNNIGKGMSFWMVGGDIGILLGPILITTVITTSSIRNTPWLMIGGIVISILLSIFLKNEPYVKSNNDNSKTIPIKDLIRIMLPLAAIILMRSIMRGALYIYLSVFMLEQGASVWLAGTSLSIMQLFGVLGVIMGGIAKDRYDFKPIMLVSIVFSVLGMVLFVFSNGILQIIALAILGISMMLILPVAMATVQENFPENRSLANGIYLAFLFAINASTGILTGYMYDQFNGFITFLASGLIALLGIPFIYLLPNYEKSPKI
jgi:FSR family fosmidomycin resistance protein-like MFS transporter